MESTRFDALARQIGERASRRGLFKGLAAALAGIAGVRALESGAEATGMARITIHNAQCNGKPKGNIYDACHDNGFGCVDFRFRGRVIRTNRKGVASARIGAGSFAISQQASRVRKSSSIYVFCSNTNNGKVLFDGAAPTGVVSFHVPAYANVVCDWYNIATTDLSMPGQCPQPTTTPRPTTTTTTTTTRAPYTCYDDAVMCTSDDDCSALANSACFTQPQGGGFCACKLGYHWSNDGASCEENQTAPVGEYGFCQTAASPNFCNFQICSNTCGIAGVDGFCAQLVPTTYAPGSVEAQGFYAVCAYFDGPPKECPCALDELCIQYGPDTAFCAKSCQIR